MLKSSQRFPHPPPYPSQFPHPHPLNHRSAMLTLISKLFILHPHTLTLSIPCLPHPLNLTPLFNPYPLTLAKLPALCPLNLTTTLESPPQPLKVPKYCPLSHWSIQPSTLNQCCPMLIATPQNTIYIYPLNHRSNKSQSNTLTLSPPSITPLNQQLLPHSHNSLHPQNLYFHSSFLFTYFFLYFSTNKPICRVIIRQRQ